MPHFRWDDEKNKKLKNERGISFEEVVLAIENGDLIGVESNPSKSRPDQKVYVVEINAYAYFVPFVRNENEIFLKTIIPSRKATKKYLGGH